MKTCENRQPQFPNNRRAVAEELHPSVVRARRDAVEAAQRNAGRTWIIESPRPAEPIVRKVAEMPGI